MSVVFRIVFWFRGRSSERGRFPTQRTPAQCKYVSFVSKINAKSEQTRRNFLLHYSWIRRENFEFYLLHTSCIVSQ